MKITKQIGISLFEDDLICLQVESNRKEFAREKELLANRCKLCKVCILEKYYTHSDGFLLEALPKQGDIWSKECQCEEILHILEHPEEAEDEY